MLPLLPLSQSDVRTFMQAVASGNVDRMKEMLEKNEELLTAKDSTSFKRGGYIYGDESAKAFYDLTGLNALHFTQFDRSNTSLKFLLNHQKIKNLVNACSDTWYSYKVAPLHSIAAFPENPERTKLLLEAGASAFLEDSLNQTPFYTFTKDLQVENLERVINYCNGKGLELLKNILLSYLNSELIGIIREYIGNGVIRSAINQEKGMYSRKYKAAHHPLGLITYNLYDHTIPPSDSTKPHKSENLEKIKKIFKLFIINGGDLNSTYYKEGDDKFPSRPLVNLRKAIAIRPEYFIEFQEVLRTAGLEELFTGSFAPRLIDHESWKKESATRQEKNHEVSTFMLAVASGKVDQIKEMLERNASLLFEKDEREFRAGDSFNGVKILYNLSGLNALHFTQFDPSNASLKFLLSRGIVPLVNSLSDRRTYKTVFEQRDSGVYQYVEEISTRAQAKRVTPLHRIVENTIPENPERTALLVEAGADPFIADDCGITSFYEFVTNIHFDSVSLIVKNINDNKIKQLKSHLLSFLPRDLISIINDYHLEESLVDAINKGYRIRIGRKRYHCHVLDFVTKSLCSNSYYRAYNFSSSGLENIKKMFKLFVNNGGDLNSLVYEDATHLIKSSYRIGGSEYNVEKMDETPESTVGKEKELENTTTPLDTLRKEREKQPTFRDEFQEELRLAGLESCAEVGFKAKRRRLL